MSICNNDIQSNSNVYRVVTLAIVNWSRSAHISSILLRPSVQDTGLMWDLLMVLKFKTEKLRSWQLICLVQMFFFSILQLIKKKNEKKWFKIKKKKTNKINLNSKNVENVKLRIKISNLFAQPPTKKVNIWSTLSLCYNSYLRKFL